MKKLAENLQTERLLSVVVVIFGGNQYLARCLEALLSQSGAVNVEIVVPCDDRIDNVQMLREQFPSVQFIKVEGNRTYAELRAVGVRQSQGHIVAVTESHCIPNRDWCSQVIEQHANPHAAVGGALEKGDDTTLNWAVFLCDFSRYMNPVPAGPTGYLTDCNVTYKREAIDKIRHLWETEFHETTVNWALQERGETLYLSPLVIAQQQRDLRLSDAIQERYQFGRLFASTRVADQSATRRLVYAGLTILLPAILTGRVMKNVLLKRRHLGTCTRALPLIVLLNSIWSWGEFLGYLTGRAPRTLAPSEDRPGEKTQQQVETA